VAGGQAIYYRGVLKVHGNYCTLHITYSIDATGFLILADLCLLALSVRQCEQMSNSSFLLIDWSGHKAKPTT
jgi:hypothetical protein